MTCRYFVQLIVGLPDLLQGESSMDYWLGLGLLPSAGSILTVDAEAHWIMVF